MERTTEAVAAEMNYRLEVARRHNAARRLRQTRTRAPAWWQRLRSQHAA